MTEMKKLISFLTAIVCVLFLAGCSYWEAIASHKEEYLVTAVGFDQNETSVTMLLEAVVVNSDDLAAKKENRIIRGYGNSPDEAFRSVTEKITQPLNFSHTGAVVIGEGISSEVLEKIYDFCYDNDEINLAAMFVAAKRAEKLLSCERISSVGVGYDIMGLVEVAGSESGQNTENLFYQIEDYRSKPMKTVYMPFIAVDNEAFFFDGIKIFKSDKAICHLNTKDSQLLGIIKNSFGGGNFILNGKSVNFESVKTFYEFKNSEIILNIKLTPFHFEIKKQIEDFVSLWQAKGEDIFAIGNEIYYKQADVWKKIENNYEEYFKNSKITVNLHE